MVRGDVGVDEVSEAAFKDLEIQRLSESMIITESEECNRRFPAERISEVTLYLKNGTSIHSGIATAIGDPEDPPSIEEMTAKYRTLAGPVIGTEVAVEILAAIENVEADLANLISLLTRSVPRHNVASNGN